MADNLLSYKQMSKKWNAEMVIPTDANYVTRVINASFGKAKNSDNVMITLEHEIVLPEEVEIAGEMINIAGVKCKTYHTVTNFDGDEVVADKTKNSRERIEKLYSDLGISMEGIDYDNINIEPFKGIGLYVKIASEISEQRSSPTASEIEAAKIAKKPALGKIMINPMTGKELKSTYPKVTEIFGVCDKIGKMTVPY